MGKSSPSPPAAPDPTAVSAAQTKSNKETALYNFGLNNPNVNSVLGTNSYNIDTQPTHDYDAYDKALASYSGGGAPLAFKQWSEQQAQQGLNGSRGAYTHYVKGASSGGGGRPTLDQFKLSEGNPRVTQNIELSPEQQQLYDLSTSQSIDLSKLASALQGNVNASLSQPVPGSGDFATASQNAQDAYYKNQTRFLDPQFEKEQRQLDARLANQGITMGSEAYNNDQALLGRQKQSAYDAAQQNAILQGPQNAQQLFSLSSAARQMPLNEFNALRSQSQVQMPSFQPTTPAMAAPTNTAQNEWNAYGAQTNAYNQQQAASNSMTSGLFGLGGSLGAAYAGSPAGSAAITALFASDARLKENIICTHFERGLPVYQFNYISDPEKIVYRGVMAQDVALVLPQAVVMDGDYMAVNYDMLGIEFARVH